MFEEIVFDSVTQMKFRIFKNLAGQTTGIYPYRDLAAQTQLSYQQYYKLLQELDHDLLESGLIKTSLIVPNTGISTEKMALSIDEYRLHLLKSSLSFQFMQALLLKPTLGLENFLQQNYISRATISRKMQPMIKYLAKYQLKINFQKFRLEGNEIAIRLAFFYLFWLGYRNLFWPFDVAKEKASTYGELFLQDSPLSRDFVSRLETSIYSGVALTRMLQQRFAEYEPALDFMLEDNPECDLCAFENTFDLSPEHSKGELASIYFLMNFIPIYEDPADPALEKSIQTFTRKANPVWDLVESFRCFVIDELHVHMETGTKKMMMANLANIILAFYVFRGPFPNLPALVKYPEVKSAETLQLEQKIKQFLNSLLKREEFSAFRPSEKYLVQILRSGISPFYYQMTKDQPLKVGVMVESNQLLVKRLWDFLADISFVETELYHSETTYDFLITTFSQTAMEIPVYYWDFNVGYQNLSALYVALRNTYIEKNR
ncbi:helix-turn-helix domain-containing protein [Enterococcus devriesei]|uniref:helix-turn-helix domain-containing protein n=1 Tax=Enterococcus devriesei TaxID=319970 RepID=UPI0028AF5CCA|nr:helix-turn-helix domain-containing protein [Enterococcus devriesei]